MIYLFMFRTTIHASTQKTPIELMFGRQINDKLPQIGAQLEANVGISDEAREDYAERKEKGRQYADNRRLDRAKLRSAIMCLRRIW